MRIDLRNLPSDTALLHQLVRDMAVIVEHRDGEIERLQAIIKKLQRMQFGRSAERLDPDQLALALEDLDAEIGHVEESHPLVVADVLDPPAHRKPLPDHLPREEVRIEPDHAACPGCGGALHDMGESVSEILDWVPAQLRVIHIIRPKYACRACGTMAQAPAPERVIAGGMATPALLAQALHEKLCGDVFASDHLFADDTPVPVLDPGRGKTKTGRLWVYAREQRGWGGADPPAAVFLFAPDRKAERPIAHLRDFKGVLHVDGYAGFEQVAARPDVTLAACWAHTRRKFYDVAQATGSPIAEEALRRIADLYAVEADVRGKAPAWRLAARRKMSAPRVENLRLWLENQLAQVPARSTLADAIRYTLTRWKGLSRFLEDGRVELDTNPVERAIRPVALGRKNHLFAGSDGGAERWAILCSLIETAKLNGIEPYAYLTDILQRMADGYPANRLGDLLPWAWKTANPVKA